MDYSNKYYESAADADKHLFISDFGKNGLLTSVAHFHDSYEMVFLESGVCKVHVNAEEWTLQAGDAAFIDSFSTHFYTESENASGKVVVAGKNLLFNFDKGMTFDVFLKNNGCSARVISFINSLGGLVCANGAVKTGTANVILGLMQSYYPMKKRPEGKVSKIFVQILKYIDENFREEITLEFLAEKFGYAPNYFSALFNKFTDMHLREYLNRRRISEALKIKEEHPERSLSAIAAECGFSSEKTFFRCYKKYKTD